MQSSAHTRSILILIASSIVMLFLGVIWGVSFLFTSIHIPARVEDGEADLSNYPLDGFEVIRLTGEWLYYPDLFIQSDEEDRQRARSSQPLRVSVPGTWENSEKAGESLISPKGFGSYRLNLKLIEGFHYGILIPEITSAYRFYINGVLYSEKGVPGSNILMSEPESGIGLINYHARENAVLDIEISNFHYRTGGIWRALEISSQQSMLDRWVRQVGSKQQIVGVALVFSMLLMLFFLLGHRETGWLYFSLYLLAGVFRAASTDEMVILQMIKPSYHLLTLIQWGSPLVSLIFLVAFFQKQLKGVMNWIAATINIALLATYLLFILMTPPRIFSETLVLMNLLLLLTGIHCFISALVYFFRKLENRWLLLLAALLIFSGFLIDLSGTLQMTPHVVLYNISYLSSELAVILLMVMLFTRFNRAYVLATQSAKQFKKAVLERTRELEDVNARLHHLAMMDSLTSAYSRQKFDDDCQNVDMQYRSLRHTASFRLSALYVDLDNFKYQNDNFGHPVGDMLLKEFTLLLLNLVRGADSVYRVGGDEFVVILVETGPEGAEATGRRIVERFKERQFFTREIEFFSGKEANVADENRLSCSVGVASFSGGSEENLNLRALVEKADVAMLNAKHGGKNNLLVYREGMESYKEEREQQRLNTREP